MMLAAHCGPTVFAAGVLVEFDFDDDAGAFENIPDSTHPSLFAGAWAPIIGTLSDFQGNPGRALAARNYAGGNALVLTVAIARGASVSLESFAFDQLASASGPSEWTLRINDVVLGTGATTAAYASVSGAAALSGIVDLLTIELSGLGASSNSGTFRLDNFSLHGSVSAVPLSPAVVLFASGIACLRRRIV